MIGASNFARWVPLWLLVGLLLSLGSAGLACADRGEKRFEEIKADFLRLRNTDAVTDNLAAWQRLADEFQTFASDFRSHRHAPAAWLHVALVYDRLGENHSDERYTRQAIDALEILIKRYPRDALTDDAWLHKGDLLVERDERSLARQCYETIIVDFPRSDMYEVAKERLKKLLEGSSELSEENAPAQDNGELDGPVIVLDPGHGGEDFGAAGVGGLLEKDVTLAVALELEKLLQHELKARVTLTRRKDIFVPLSERTALANEVKAELFVSLHTNASPQGKLSGLEVYYLDNTNDKGSRTLAERENKSLSFEQGGAGDLQFMLSDLIQNAKLDDSIKLAHGIESAILAQLGKAWGPVTGLGVRKAPFYVLVGAHMPCVLVELFFIDHPKDGPRLAEKRFRGELAQGLLQGIKRFLAKGSRAP